MKKTFLLFLFSFFISHFASAQNPLVKMWDKRYGGDQHDYLYAFQQTTDHGYILGGFTTSDSSGDVSGHLHSNGYWDFWVIKVDSVGNKIWDNLFGGTNSELLYSIRETSDNGFLLGGAVFSDSSGDVSESSRGSSDFWILKIDSLGNKQWDKRFGGSGDDELFSLAQTHDGGFILGGYVESDSGFDVTESSRGDRDYWVVKTDNYGNKVWDKRFGGLNIDELTSVIQTSDEGYLLGGYSQSDSTGDVSQHTRGYADFWEIKIDSSGNKQWDRRYGGNNNDVMISLSQTYDGGYILFGGSQSDVSGEVSEPNHGPPNF